MIDQYTIKKKLSRLEVQFSVAFAARSALRVMPQLAIEGDVKDPFWYWEAPVRSKYLLGILRAYQISVAFAVGCQASEMKVSDYEDISNGVISAAYASPVTATQVMVIGNTAAATAAAFSMTTSQSAAKAYDLPATYASSICTQVKEKKIRNGMEKDLNFITQVAAQSISPLDFLTRPLWSTDDELPENSNEQWELLLQWMDQMDDGFSPWSKWLQDQFEGKALDLDLLQKQIDIPKEIKSQGPKEINNYLANL